MQVQKFLANDVLLDVRDLETHFLGEKSVIRAVGGVSFQVRRGKHSVSSANPDAGKASPHSPFFACCRN